MRMWCTAAFTGRDCWPLSPAEGMGRFRSLSVLAADGSANQIDSQRVKVRQWAEFGFFAMSIEYRLIGCTRAGAIRTLCAIRWITPTPQVSDRQAASSSWANRRAAIWSRWRQPSATVLRRTGGWEDQPHDFRPPSVSRHPELPSSVGNGWSPAGAIGAARELASPIKHVTKKTKPIDPALRRRQIGPHPASFDMVQALKAKVRHRFVHYPDKGHM